MPKLTEEEKSLWLEKIKRWESSGLSIVRWCHSEGECYRSFLRIRAELKPTPLKRRLFQEVMDEGSPLCFECKGVKLHFHSKSSKRDLILGLQMLREALC